MSRDPHPADRDAWAIPAALATGMLFSVVLAACPSKQEQVDAPVPQYGLDAGTTTTTTTTTTPPPPPPTAQACDPTVQLALQTALKAREKTELSAGMKPESVFGCMVVPEGGSTSVPITLAQGRCYSFLAQSFPNVTELDLFLKPNLGPNPSPLVAPFVSMFTLLDSETGPLASINAGKDCFKNPAPFPVAALVEVKARVGSGPVAVQVYSK
jgi:hypothetical protein